MTYQEKLDRINAWPGAPYRMPCLKDEGWKCGTCPLTDAACREIRGRKDSLTVKDEFVKAWQSEAEPDDYDKASAYYHFRGSWQHTAAESGWHFRRYTPPARKE